MDHLLPVLLVLVVLLCGLSLWLVKRVRSLATSEEQVRAQFRQTSRERDSLLGSMIERAGEGVVLIVDGRIVQANLKAMDFLGRVRSEVIGSSFLDYISPDCVEQMAEIYSKRVKGIAIPSLYETRFCRKDGVSVDVEVSGGLITYEGGLADLVFFRDMSVHKQVEQSLRRQSQQLEAANRQLEAAMVQANELAKKADAASKAKGEFLANMSHELRTPLTTIIGMNELLRDGAFGRLSQEQLDGLRTIEASSQHLLELINDILDLARVESGIVELERKPLDVRSLCSSCMEFLRDAAEKKHLSYTMDLAGAPDKLWADPRRLRQILINLLGNAIKFTPENGSIGLVVRPLEKTPGIRFTVWDNGIGISQDKIDAIFQPFEQGDSGMTRRHGGTGLGLAMVQRLVHLHGGSISVHSAPGHGSQFVVSITDPVSRISSLGGAASLSDGSNAKSLQGLRILLAEDDPTNARIIELQLARRGAQATVAFNGQEALLAVSRQAPDLVVMDVQMPVLDGLKATRQLKLNPATKAIPVICLTALVLDEDRQRCLDAGADEYVTKPVDINLLVSIIERLSRGRSPQSVA